MFISSSLERLRDATNHLPAFAASRGPRLTDARRAVHLGTVGVRA
jgi:hypothetical protein